MAGLLQIRNVPEAAKRTLKARAAERGESLNTYMLRLIEREAARPDVAHVLARAALRAERSRRSAARAIAEARTEHGA